MKNESSVFVTNVKGLISVVWKKCVSVMSENMWRVCVLYETATSFKTTIDQVFEKSYLQWGCTNL